MMRHFAPCDDGAMRFVSTRNPRQRATFSEAIQVGPAPDGGLYVPEPIACFRDIPRLLEMDFQDRSLTILHRLLGEEFSLEDLEGPVLEAFDFPIPLAPIGDRVRALELFHGPTLSLKDFGARFLAGMLVLLGSKQGPRLRTILVATSGDLGAAVAHAFWKERGCRVVILYPQGRVPEFREQQLASLGGNILAFAVDGTLEDCQVLVDACFEDAALVKALNLAQAGAANVAELLAGLLLFFEALAQLKAQGQRDAPVVAVPCGSLGTLYAGLLAKAMGLPIKAFVVATNANRVVPEWLESREFRPRPPIPTLAPALDSGHPASWERLEHILGSKGEGSREGLRWGSLDDQGIRRALWELNHFGYLSEPHGAVAYGVLEERRGLGETGIFLATADPALAQEILRQDMNLAPELPPALAECLTRPLLARPLPNDLAGVKKLLLD
jgi:threonine synthase